MAEQITIIFYVSLGFAGGSRLRVRRAGHALLVPKENGNARWRRRALERCRPQKDHQHHSRARVESLGREAARQRQRARHVRERRGQKSRSQLTSNVSVLSLVCGADCF